MNMKIFKYISLILVVVFAASCEKHEIQFPATDLPDGYAEFQLHYMAPVAVNTANNMYKIEINDVMYTNETAILSTYNAVPSGAVGLFYAVKAGTVNIKMYNQAGDLKYDQNTTLAAKKQNIVIYDLTLPPVVIDNGYPYATVISENTATVGWVKFYNFMYEVDAASATGVSPTTSKLQYQYFYTDPATKVKSDWINVGEPVAFGEATGFQQVTVLKDTYNSGGSARLDYRIMVQDADGNYTVQLQVINSSSKMVDYTDWWTAAIGRNYHHFFAGVRTKAPIVGVKTFTAR